MIIDIMPICFNCKHFIKNSDKGSCGAFDKIPKEIFNEGDPHTKPLPTQKNKIVFEPKN